MKQIFGYTPDHTPSPSSPYAPYVALHSDARGTLRITVRNQLGVVSETEIPADKASDLAGAILAGPLK